MATKLRDGSKLRREIRVHGVEAAVIVTLTSEGIEARVSGTKTAVWQRWERVVASMNTPGNVPSYLAAKPVEFLKYQANKKFSRRRKKEPPSS